MIGFNVQFQHEFYFGLKIHLAGLNVCIPRQISRMVVLVCYRIDMKIRFGKSDTVSELSMID